MIVAGQSPGPTSPISEHNFLHSCSAYFHSYPQVPGYSRQVSVQEGHLRPERPSAGLLAQMSYLLLDSVVLDSWALETEGPLRDLHPLAVRHVESITSW
jgi:hypothetical protein